MFRRVGVQVVTYRNRPDQLTRLAEGIGAAVRMLRNAGVDDVAVRFGDCTVPSSLGSVASRLRHELDGAVDDVEFVEFGANLGSAGGSNALAAGRHDDAIWVLNPDTYPAPRCAVELLGALAADGVAAVDGRQIPVEHPKAYDPVTGEASWVSGACMMLRRTAFDAVGGFDAHFFPMYCDDVDLSWRLRLAGWRTVHAPRAVVSHDKRVGPDGSVVASDLERRAGTLARLWLARRYARPDVEADTLERIAADGDAALLDAAREFHERVGAGDVPAPLDGADSVAQFVGDDYARHRFGYGA